MVLRGTFSDKVAKIRSLSREALEQEIVDSHYNDFIADRADYGDRDVDRHGYGKRVPYIGWYWRDIPVYGDWGITIGGGEFVGFMMNNKWDYPERDLSPDEKERVISILDAAIAASQRGGLLSDTEQSVNDHLDQLWDYLQTLVI